MEEFLLIAQTCLLLEAFCDMLSASERKSWEVVKNRVVWRSNELLGGIRSRDEEESKECFKEKGVSSFIFLFY